MKKKKSKKKQTSSNLKDQKLGQTKNSAKLVLFVFWDRSNYWHNNIFIQ